MPVAAAGRKQPRSPGSPELFLNDTLATVKKKIVFTRALIQNCDPGATIQMLRNDGALTDDRWLPVLPIWFPCNNMVYTRTDWVYG